MMPITVVQPPTARKRSLLLYLMFSLEMFQVISCGNANDKHVTLSNITGQIILDVVEPRNTHSAFIVSPREGTVLRFSRSPATDSNVPTRVIQSCHTKPTSISPDHKVVAECRGDAVATITGSKPDEFILRSAESPVILYQRSLGQRICGFLWSPDSRAIAVLTQTVHISLNPRYWFYALSGHPMQYESYYLHAIDVANFHVASFKIPLEASFSTGELISWMP